MFERIYLGSIIFFFIAAFAIRNIKTAVSTGVSIKGKSKLLSFSVILSSFIYLIITCRLSFLEGNHLFEANLDNLFFIKWLGLGLVTFGFFIGIAALIALKNSWRVGIRYEQKTELITSGIYKFSRNPYFLSYNILILGFILVFPTLLLAIPYVALVIVFNKMILKEENYLEKTHGQEYLNYKNKTGRYLTI